MKREVADFLQSHCVGVLATLAADGSPQAATIFYIFDNEGGLIFKSRATSEHIIGLEKNSLAAVAVYDHESNYKEKTGVQLKGVVSRITDFSRMSDYIVQYGKSFEGSLEKFSPVAELISSAASSTLYRFQVSSFKYTDSAAGIADIEYRTW
ncbi:pyridoxamine 5'-phosphate oxidase family protein [Roseibium litorale]|uniref:Pyridoxamine 5'-phosphate oxidase family protein n=1 Tax=Roseibium litorale TaxID=2803841 RepID=A0ABR9CTA8_9HYPH|nr:pyridoxamine 5'-phosphate oxidase family protein [Roseibium litorale]MBD8894121.1 pyridoxamine 5'-phosphate oxidase family protein [Roseibium litorale]